MLNDNIQTRALLVHHHTTTNNIDVTTHTVMDLGGGQFTLGAGRAMSLLDKESLVALLLNEEGKGEFLDESILVSSRSTLCWYRKPSIAEIPFHGARVKSVIPGLIFIAVAGARLRCFAYKGKGRPSATTELYYAPFGNVYKQGDFCTGNASVPTTITKSNIPAWEGFVLDATNTHSGAVNPVIGVDDIQQLQSFYEALAASGAKAFPNRSLRPFNIRTAHQSAKPTSSTLGEVLFEEGR